VGDTLREREPVAVLQPVAETLLLRVGEEVPEGDVQPDAEGEKDADTVADSQRDTLPLPVEVEVREGEGVCETLIVPLRLTVGLRVTEGHTLREGVSVASDVALALGEPDTEEQLDGEFEAEAL
jgi:hypothetical protein